MVRLDDARECRLVRPDGRTVAWLDLGDPAGTPVLWVPGTPGARWSWSAADLHEWTERGLRVLSTERPGFGASTRLPGRRFCEHADDLAAVLDASGVQTAYVYGESGAAPHILSFLSRHPDRARAATILVGAAPLVDAEAEQMIELNRVEWFLMKDGDRARIEANLRPWWQEELRDPVAAMLQVLDGGPESDRRVLQDATFLSNVERSTREALSTEENFQAWIDESFALRFGWDDIELDRISTSITWYHGHGDTTAPFTAARRLVDRLPTARLVEIEDAGHLALFDQGGPVLDELLSRGAD